MYSLVHLRAHTHTHTHTRHIGSDNQDDDSCSPDLETQLSFLFSQPQPRQCLLWDTRLWCAARQKTKTMASWGMAITNFPLENILCDDIIIASTIIIINGILAGVPKAYKIFPKDNTDQCWSQKLVVKESIHGLVAKVKDTIANFGYFGNIHSVVYIACYSVCNCLMLTMPLLLHNFVGESLS